MIQAILEAAEIWKAGVIKLAKEPEPARDQEIGFRAVEP